MVKESKALVTDLYQLTMACGYWQSGLSERESVFHLFFRKNPFGGGYTVSAGLEYLLEYIKGLRFEETDIDFLAGLKGKGDRPLFSGPFLEYLKSLQITCSIDAIPEGTICFPFEPLVRVQGPLIQCQLLESAFLNIVNFSSLIATKAARVKKVAGENAVLEFGLRRSQGFDGGLCATRATYIGGVDATSNVYAAKQLGIPAKGTHAHSWVMSFDSEQESFDQWGEVMPHNSILLVDTYDSIKGVEKAIETGRKLRSSGHDLMGIRLDSGDLVWLSKEARKRLDAAGFKDSKIVASNDLDEYQIQSLRNEGAQVDIWGVGTKLITAYDQPALGGVYKISAIKDVEGNWKSRIKLSEQLIKVSNPGIQQVRRYYNNGVPAGDAIYDTLDPAGEEMLIIDQMDMTRRKRLSACSESEDLLVRYVQDGKEVVPRRKIDEIRDTTLKGLSLFDEGIYRLEDPYSYPVGLEKALFEKKTDLVMNLRGTKEV